MKEEAREIVDEAMPAIGPRTDGALARPSHQRSAAPALAPESAALVSVEHPRRTDSTPAALSVDKPRIFRHLHRLATNAGEKVGLAIDTASAEPFDLDSLTRGTSIYRLRRGQTAPMEAPRWELATLSGRLVELSSSAAAAGLTLAFSLVLDAQFNNEPVAWLTPRERSFFPPDAAASGVDLEALVVIRTDTGEQLPRAAEHLLRSGAFGLVVLDLSDHAHISIPMQMRLVGLAQKHDAVVLCITRKRADAPSLGSLVSLRAEARRERIDRSSGDRILISQANSDSASSVTGDEYPVPRTPAVPQFPRSWGSTFACTARVLKDKRRRPGWTHREVCRGPHGLR